MAHFMAFSSIRERGRIWRRRRSWIHLSYVLSFFCCCIDFYLFVRKTRRALNVDWRGKVTGSQTHKEIKRFGYFCCISTAPLVLGFRRFLWHVPRSFDDGRISRRPLVLSNMKHHAYVKFCHYLNLFLDSQIEK